MVSAEQLKDGVRTTFDAAAQNFDQAGFGFFARFGARLVELAEVSAGNAVLDVGCGNGSSIFPARERVGAGAPVIGIDLAPQMVARVNERAEAAGLTNLVAKVMDGEQPDFAGQAFDVILAGFSIMHFPSAPDCLRAYRELLAPGGRFCFSELVDEGGLPSLVPTDVFELLKPHFPSTDEDPQERGRRTWTDSADSIESSLLGLGFDRVDIVEEVTPLDIGSGDAWIAWAMSTGLRVAWDRLPRAEAAGLTDAVRTLIERRRVDGTIQLAVRVRYILAYA